MKFSDENTKVVINYISHNGQSLYRDLKDKTEKYGIIVSYDGFEIEI